MIHSYPSVYAIGHKAIEEIFLGPVLIEEKINGSQFSWGIIDGELQCRSKGKQFILDAPEKMFQRAVDFVQEIAPMLKPDWVYRAEYLQKPHHNTLVYDRVPAHNLIIYDINTGLEDYMPWEKKRDEAARLGLECVPFFYHGIVQNFDMFKDFLDHVSCLGGTKVEGIVVKNYALFTAEKKVAMGKYVSESFKEIHTGEWRKANPTSGDIVDTLIVAYRTPARWQKAVQHLRDAGNLEWSTRDIGNLIKAVPEDVLKECEDEIKQRLFSHFWPKIRRGITAGLANWYKDELAKSAFESHDESPKP